MPRVAEAFASNWVAPLGPHVDAFEAELALITQRTAVAALGSGTAAIHLALLLLDVRPGDIVLCQSLTFSGTANPIAYVGATPAFVDSESETWNMCPQALRTAIEHYRAKGVTPKAIIPVHLYGMPAKISAILAIAEEYGVPVIEDAAEALGSSFEGRPCGAFGLMSILSFNGNKIITTSGGGALLSNSRDLISRAKYLASQARQPQPHYEHTEIGYNYRLSNVLAGIGRGQLEVLESRVARRRANYQRYARFFSSRPGISLLSEPGPGVFSNRWLTTLQVDPRIAHGITREDLRLALEQANIESRPLWKPMHLQPVFRGCAYFGSDVGETLFRAGLCLPSGSNLSEQDFERIFTVLASVLKA